LCTALLFGILVVELRQVGWSVVAGDARHPLRTLRMMMGVGEADLKVGPYPDGRRSAW
jgi:hypothetical protein